MGENKLHVEWTVEDGMPHKQFNLLKDEALFAVGVLGRKLSHIYAREVSQAQLFRSQPC